jgi:hypothetical protein
MKEDIVKEPKKIHLKIGAMVEPFSDQLKAQSFKFDKKTIAELQSYSDYLFRMMFTKILTQSQVSKAFVKINELIVDHLNKVKK